MNPEMVEACIDLLADRAPDAPEERVMLALLLDAVIQLQRRGTTSAAAAATWVRGDEGHGTAISFATVCASLGVDTEHLARGLLRGADVPPPRPAPQPRRARTLRRRMRSARGASPFPLLGMIVLHALQRSPLWVRIVTLAFVPFVVGGLTALVLPSPAVP